MKPATRGEGDTSTASEPSKLGRAEKADGGATAPAQTAEQALQDECAFFAMPDADASSSAAALASWAAWAAWSPP